jgi:NTE family protein
MLVDGGLVENLPTSVLRPMGARTVIAVDLNTQRGYERPDDMVDIMLNAIDIAINNATRLQTREGIDLVIAPKLSEYGRLPGRHGAKLVEEGHMAARDALEGWHGMLRTTRGRNDTSMKNRE